MANFLQDNFRGVSFVAWNANRFDAYFVAASLLADDRYRIQPFLTRNHALRGLRIVGRGDSPKVPGWLFVDGLAMLGLEGTSLAAFLHTFAPEYGKLTDIIDFRRGDSFDPGNVEHRRYAMRDSQGLWHGMDHAQRILMDHFDEPLGVTMGGACIKIFQANIPPQVRVRAPTAKLEGILRDYVMRGGYCHCVRPYQGPVWKYDINQAYAAAMREAPLPCGDVIEYSTGVRRSPAWIAKVRASNPRNRVPFYYRGDVGGRLRTIFGIDEITDTWLTSIEIEQLESEGWRVEIMSSWCWSDAFVMREYVDRLESRRMTCEGGPKGPIGTMIKAVGNHSYGKLAEEVPAIEFLISAQPDIEEGWCPYYADDGDEPIANVHFRFPEQVRAKDHHVVQLGAFITASVRMKVRRAALLDPEGWLYADTDCVMYSRPDSEAKLDIHPTRYGAWKIEEQGRMYRVIAKKVYAEVAQGDGRKPVRIAKGLHVDDLSDDDFARWITGSVPVQRQTQRQNFLKVMEGSEMFRALTRSGTAVSAGSISGPTSRAKPATQGT